MYISQINELKRLKDWAAGRGYNLFFYIENLYHKIDIQLKCVHVKESSLKSEKGWASN